MAPQDTLARPLKALRVSVTDRCNFRCPYCMPRENFGDEFSFLDRKEILTFEEIQRLVRIFIGLGVEKVRLTGGEPLLRRGLALLVEELGRLPGLRETTLTTNGSLLASQALPRSATPCSSRATGVPADGSVASPFFARLPPKLLTSAVLPSAATTTP